MPEKKYRSAATQSRNASRALVCPSEVQSVLRPDHEPLHELHASVLLVEAQRPQVPEEVAVRVARRPLGYRPLPFDHQGTVARLPGAGLVLLLQPVCDDGLAPPHYLLALVVGVVGVDGVLPEECSYGRGVVGAPGVHVGVEPPLDGVVGQDAPPFAATSGFGCFLVVLIPPPPLDPPLPPPIR